jgi:hypothetical protein
MAQARKEGLRIRRLNNVHKKSVRVSKKKDAESI